MKRILLIDTNYGFTSDLESRLILSDLDDYDFTMLNNADNIPDAINRQNPDEVIVAAGLLSSNPNWNFPMPVTSYARKAEELALSKETGIPCYGIIQRATDLLSAIENGTTVSFEPPRAVEEKSPDPAGPAEDIFMTARQSQEKENAPKDVYDSRQAQYPKPTVSVPADTQENPGSHQEYRMPQTVPPMTGNIPNVQQTSQPSQTEYDTAKETGAFQQKDYRQPEPYRTPESVPEPEPPRTYTSSRTNVSGADFRKQLAAAREKEEAERRRKEAEEAGRVNHQAEHAVDLALGNIRKPAKTIAVYSAKGGVGKTTVACELATYLALVTNGRSNFKVCVADFDIDFGDVLNTLSFDPNKACMSLWAADIRERLAALPVDRNGLHTPEQLATIRYTENEVSLFLQHNERDGLYALLAPISNEDSMDISEEEVKVMIDNLIYNGGFDFVICDTGNNTKDSSFISLEKADEILLIHTQSVNTVNCNAGLLSMLEKINFDMNKIKLIINKAKPAKSVGVSIQEVQEALLNPYTGKPYDCIAVIKNTDDASHSNNTGEPLVYKSGHDFTKSIAAIAADVIDDDFRLQPKKKKGLFSRMFGKK